MFQFIISFVICVQIISSIDVFDTGRIMQIDKDNYKSDVMWYDYKQDTLLPLDIKCPHCHIVVVNIVDCE